MACPCPVLCTEGLQLGRLLNIVLVTMSFQWITINITK
jgi:hypothetical protein